MKESDKSGASSAWISTLVTVIATAVGAYFGLAIGQTFVSGGLGAGVLVLLLTVAGAIVGRYYVGSTQPWWGNE